MGNLSFIGFKCDKRLLIAYIVVIICSVISGIVLCTVADFNIYFINFTSEYIYKVFNFNNFSLLLIRLFSSILYAYLFFLICYFTNCKYLVLIFIFIRGLVCSVYTVIMVSIGTIGGVLVAVFVFIPSSLVSFALLYLICDSCKNINKKYLPWFPAIFALADVIIMLLLVNVVFRVVIIIV